SVSTVGLKPKKIAFEHRKSSLVYEVKPLPDQILDYVWDYGTLQSKDEKIYIQIMVQEAKLDPIFAELLFASQNFIRNVEEPYSVSLRDVKRAIKLFDFFNKSLLTRKNEKKKYPDNSVKIHIRSYVLALGLCYQSRLYEHEQMDYMSRMTCPPNTAFNEALLENVLAAIVCIMCKIPLFIVGAPGSSKSLAIRLVYQNLRGLDSNDTYFSTLPHAFFIPHQGSSSSTSDGIEKVFQKAKAYQKTSSDEFPVISVVLLDEGNPYNPLKVLHSLLEPSYPVDGPTVSVIGISNWRLDNSKNSEKDLVNTLQEWTWQMSTIVGTEGTKFTIKDLFMGFNKEETLQSLIIDIKKKEPMMRDRDILNKCKEYLVAIATPDGMVRIERSTLEFEEIQHWKNVYFQVQHHNGIADYFQDLLQVQILKDNQDGHL
ncbi:11316_t:CDS:2, partial [Funneliformis geosporum]